MSNTNILSIDKIRQSRWQDILEKLSEYPLGIAEDGRQSLKNMEKGPQDKEVRPSGLNRVSIHGLILPAGVVGPTTDAAFKHLSRCAGVLTVLCLILCGQWLIVQFGGPVFRTVPLAARDWGILLAVSSLVLWVGEAGRLFKRLCRKKAE